LPLWFVPFGHWVVWGGVGKWSQARFNRVPEKVPEKVPGGFGAEPGQVRQGSGESSGEGLGAFGAAR